MDAFLVREMSEDDLPRVSRIVCDGYRWLAERERYTNEQLDAVCAQRGSVRAIREQSRDYQFLVALKGVTIAGIVALKGNEITKLFVDTAYHRQGIGRRLFQEAERMVEAAGHETVFLGAFRTSVPFYEAMGMSVVRDHLITVGPLKGRTSLIMEKAL